LTHIKKAFEILAAKQLVVKPTKCIFGKIEVDYLGHIVIIEGVKVNPKKIEAMQTWPGPKTIIELRGFLGLARYYRKFVKKKYVVL